METQTYIDNLTAVLKDLWQSKGYTYRELIERIEANGGKLSLAQLHNYGPGKTYKPSWGTIVHILAACDASLADLHDLLAGDGDRMERKARIAQELTDLGAGSDDPDKFAGIIEMVNDL